MHVRIDNSYMYLFNIHMHADIFNIVYTHTSISSNAEEVRTYVYKQCLTLRDA